MNAPQKPVQRAREHADSLARLAPVLTAEQKYHLLRAVLDAFRTAGESIAAADFESQIQTDKLTGRTPVRTAEKEKPGFVRCPHCQSDVRKDRLNSHVARVHGAGTVQPSGQRRRSRGQMICGDCNQEMPRVEYPTHDCKPPRSREIRTVRGGAPGLGRRR
jgi:hypothetical protein